MAKTLTTIRLSARVLEILDTLADGESRQRTALIERAVTELGQRETTGDLWVGAGPWQGWRLTTAHAASGNGWPVLVRPDGSALGPGDIRKR